MEVPTASGKGVGQDLATVAKDEKILLLMAAKNRYQDHIWYDESENHPLDEQQQRVGEYLTTDAMKLIKLCCLLHGNEGLKNFVVFSCVTLHPSPLPRSL